MSNATDVRDYIVNGFAELQAHLRGDDDRAEIRNRIKLNTEARQRAQERTRKEYAELGMVPPSDIALSITALRVMADVDAERNRTLGVDQPAMEAAE